jgi:hypothetical protein
MRIRFAVNDLNPDSRNRPAANPMKLDLDIRIRQKIHLFGFYLSKSMRREKCYAENEKCMSNAVSGIRDIFVRIRILGSVLVTNGSGCGPCSIRY